MRLSYLRVEFLLVKPMSIRTGSFGVIEPTFFRCGHVVLILVSSSCS